MLTCHYCGLTSSEKSGDFQLDTHSRGFWCESCDGFSYLNNSEEKHHFTLILEDKNGAMPENISPPVKLKKQLSPLRYPGGKSKLINYLFSHMNQRKCEKLISPFTGGGSFELALLDAGLIGKLHLNDLDTGVFSLWWIILQYPNELIERINIHKPNHEDYYQAQSVIKNDYNGVDMIEAAWALLIVNRLAYSGIVKSGPLGGKKGTQDTLLSRWNPMELIKRIEYITSLSEQIIITQENAISLIEEAYWSDTATIFIDPPYVNKGKDLYHCYYDENQHIELSFLLNSLHQGTPGADIILTYDYNDWLNDLYIFPEKKVIGRKYSA